MFLFSCANVDHVFFAWYCIFVCLVLAHWLSIILITINNLYVTGKFINLSNDLLLQSWVWCDMICMNVNRFKVVFCGYNLCVLFVPMIQKPPIGFVKCNFRLFRIFMSLSVGVKMELRLALSWRGTKLKKCSVFLFVSTRVSVHDVCCQIIIKYYPKLYLWLIAWLKMRQVTALV